ncbi:MAG: hypothetical protein V2I27_03930 [Erythrobacter sp.]|jgi:hypothetical protein|nr:hypothetical protein [Erythrobacter sp.]
MRRSLLLGLVVSLASPAISGCVARTAAAIVTAPIKVVSKGVDLATTSQSEADEKRGREIRKREEQLAKLERRYAKELKNCREGDRRECRRAQETYNEMQQLIPTIPVEPES